MPFPTVAPLPNHVASVQSLLSVIVPGLGLQQMEEESRTWRPTIDRLVGAAEAQIICPTHAGPGYLYRRPGEPQGYSHLILRPGRFGPPNFEIGDGAPPLVRLIAVHGIAEITGHTETRHFVALGAIVKAACREGEFFELRSDLADPVFTLIGMMTGAAAVFERTEDTTLRGRWRTLRRELSDRVLDLLSKKTGWD